MTAVEGAPDMEFLGAILTAQVRSSQAASNAVTDRMIEDAIAWAKDFERFFLMIERANETIDSARLETILWNWRHIADNVPDHIEHLERMRMGQL